ncbi:MAG: polysaccharide deacetylase family protein [archaeon]
MKNKKTIITLTIILMILLILYFSYFPKSQFFGKVVNKIDTEEKIVILTFDDGPGTETEEILDVLKEKNVSAVFFVVGQRALDNPETIRLMVENGHEVGLHTLSHHFLLTKNEFEISEGKKIVENITGFETKYFRPPYGFRIPTTIKVAKELGLTTITWSIYPRDYSRPGEEKIVSRIVNNLKSGSIIALHDGPENREQTLNALSDIIDETRKQGYEFRTLSELIK